jgi:hypothetical protein
MRSPLATSLVLLALIWHAFLVSSTHVHRIQSNEDRSSIASMSGRGGAEPAPASSNHAQCLLCSLQRNFVSDLQHSAPAIAAPEAQATPHADLPTSTISAAPFLAPSGRAPPRA